MQSHRDRTSIRRLTIANLRSVTGLIIGLYVTMHLSNHALGLISVHAQEASSNNRTLFHPTKTSGNFAQLVLPAAAVLAGAARDSGVEKNLQWSMSNKARFTENRESSFNFRSRI
jgi:hypothetical protein